MILAGQRIHAGCFHFHKLLENTLQTGGCLGWGMEAHLPPTLCLGPQAQWDVLQSPERWVRRGAVPPSERAPGNVQGPVH